VETVLTASESPKKGYGEIKFDKAAKVLDVASLLGKAVKLPAAVYQEDLDQNFGFTLYSTVVKGPISGTRLTFDVLHDRAAVYFDGKLMGIFERDRRNPEIVLDLKVGDAIKVDILVENMGRICYGEDTYFGDPKGLTGGVELTFRKNGDVRIPGKVAFNWDVTCLDMDNPEQIQFEEGTDAKVPAFFRGTFKTDSRDSCFVRFDNLKKGFIWINGFNIGRYWERGPLEALYIPGALLEEENEIIVFETDGFRGEPTVEITNVSGIPNHHPEIIV
jgi:beta-galactosidase